MWNPTHAQVTVCQARNLKVKGKNGTNDAYVVIKVDKDKFQTSVRERCKDPEWWEQCDFPLSGHRMIVKLKVFHRSLIGRDAFLGQIELDLEQFKVHERSKQKWYPLLDKPNSKALAQYRGELQVAVTFNVKSLSSSQLVLNKPLKSGGGSLKVLSNLRGRDDKADSKLRGTSLSLRPDSKHSLKDSPNRTRTSVILPMSYNKSSLSEEGEDNVTEEGNAAKNDADENSNDSNSDDEVGRTVKFASTVTPVSLAMFSSGQALNSRKFISQSTMDISTSHSLHGETERRGIKSSAIDPVNEEVDVSTAEDIADDLRTNDINESTQSTVTTAVLAHDSFDYISSESNNSDLSTNAAPANEQHDDIVAEETMPKITLNNESCYSVCITAVSDDKNITDFVDVINSSQRLCEPHPVNLAEDLNADNSKSAANVFDVEDGVDDKTDNLVAETASSSVRQLQRTSDAHITGIDCTAAVTSSDDVKNSTEFGPAIRIVCEDSPVDGGNAKDSTARSSSGHIMESPLEEQKAAQSVRTVTTPKPKRLQAAVDDNQKVAINDHRTLLTVDRQRLQLVQDEADAATKNARDTQSPARGDVTSTLPNNVGSFQTQLTANIAREYSSYSKEDLIQLIVKQRIQLREREAHVAELERYIDNLLAKVIDLQPMLLCSPCDIGTPLKRSPASAAAAATALGSGPGLAETIRLQANSAATCSAATRQVSPFLNHTPPAKPFRSSPSAASSSTGHNNGQRYFPSNPFATLQKKILK